MQGVDNRCRLVLVVPRMDAAELRSALDGALRGGDVASVIIPQYELAEHAFQALCEDLVPAIQAAGAAAIVAGDTRIAGRVKADGLHVEGGPAPVGEAVEKFAPRLIVGAGGAKDRHQALEIGEHRPDYLFLGKLDGDIKPEAHPKMLALAEWWASMIEIPCIAMGGTAIASVAEVAETGAEFVALRQAVFGEPAAAAQMVAQANAILDEKAPRFED